MAKAKDWEIYGLIDQDGTVLGATAVQSRGGIDYFDMACAFGRHLRRALEGRLPVYRITAGTAYDKWSKAYTEYARNLETLDVGYGDLEANKSPEDSEVFIKIWDSDTDCTHTYYWKEIGEVPKAEGCKYAADALEKFKGKK